jgi:hypothetical protein
MRLKEAGYVRIEKTFRGKVPLTLCSLTRGRAVGIRSPSPDVQARARLKERTSAAVRRRPGTSTFQNS